MTQFVLPVRIRNRQNINTLWLKPDRVRRLRIAALAEDGAPQMTREPRHEFTPQVKESLGKRVALHCSNPNCRRITSGPADDPARAINVGVAAHITAASPGGARYDGLLTRDARSSFDNGIWLCSTCATLIDRDRGRFTVPLLRDWKQRAEHAAQLCVGAGTGYRPIAANELRQQLTVGELAAIKSLEEEFGCRIEVGVSVPHRSGGWLNLQGAVVRGEDLVAIDIHEFTGKGIAYFQIDHLVKLGQELRFERFKNFVLYEAIVSSAEPDQDAEVERRLENIKATAGFEMHLRMLRLNPLRARFGM
jgi:hypothetical protein